MKTVTIGISTRDRSDLWKKGHMVNSLLRQSEPPDEILICDDNSQDDTIETIRERLPGARIFRTEGGERSDSARPDNVLFKEATGEVFIHMDDDGYVHHRLCEFIRRLGPGACYWGNNVYLDPETMKVLGRDVRFEMMQVNLNEAVTLPHGLCTGALYAVDTKLLRQLGGHDLNHIGYRGCDNRLGARIHSRVPCWFMGQPYMTFFHFGWSEYLSLKNQGKQVEYSKWRAPGLDKEDYPVIANGGEQFWQDLGGYEEV